MAFDTMKLHTSTELYATLGSETDFRRLKNYSRYKADNRRSCGCYYVLATFVIAMLVATCVCMGWLAADAEPPAGLAPPPIATTDVISCYYNTPDPSSNASSQLLPSQIHPHLCTHINVAFAQVVNKEVYLDSSQYVTLSEVIKLKRENPTLKVLLSVGGAGGNNGFSDMVVDHASRKVFIKSIKNVLRNYSLDGVDLDWEFPALHTEREEAPRERQHFSQLLREIRAEYIREKRNYLLTVAIAAPETIADISYDVDQINLYVDFANIMSYDYHYFSKYTPFTGLNSPLYRRPTEELFLATLNVNYTVHSYIGKGLTKSKIVVGIPTYGHTFRLVNAENPGVGSPAAGVGALGGHGFASYPAVCAFRAAHADVAERWDGAARAPYLSRAREWVSYESPRSVAAKAEFVRALGLRGAMLYSLNADDFAGECARSAGRFPLARRVRRALRAGGARAPDVPVSSGRRR